MPPSWCEAMWQQTPTTSCELKSEVVVSLMACAQYRAQLGVGAMLRAFKN